MPHRATPTTSSRARRARLIASSAVAAGLLATAFPTLASATNGDSEGAPVCTETSILPGITQGSQSFTDKGVAVFVGGDYLALPEAAESEGRLVVGGTTTISAGLFNLGRAGGGSQITPPPGSDMLISLGAVTVTAGSNLHVGHGLEKGTKKGGNVLSGGDITGTMDLNGGTAKPNKPGATSTKVDAARETLATASQKLAALEANGTLGTDSGWPALIGDGTDATQVFSLTAQQADDLGAVTFKNVGTDTPIVINVSGTTARLDSTYVAGGNFGQRIDDFTKIGAWAPRIVWNFPDATELTLAGGSQLVGSILAPEADVADSTHTNGRLWVGGDLTFGGSYSGLEHHNYPWIGASELGCEPTDIPEPPVVVPTVPPLPPVPTQSPEPTESSTPTESVTPSDEPSATPSESVSSTPSESPEVLGTSVPSPSESPEVLGTSVPSPEAEEGGLAMTGATVATASIVALLLAGGGAALLILRRRAAQQG
ncbi:choice-of-anchor A domain-containing protein [Sediminihabitans luteus]|uniref:Choice-of-anchor A domain-containing protein n=1 Tax=Sediminihabitans luteus TaxID=1138585 RepID=A0A2M9CR00_9CELL|nr:choice-of-anchor A family protein [Sediminihabitans luteus]PJJ74319.1 choice-of-anchor A domain-containing protein [Sediminihabitans luteus]GII99172.1 hypothetical protein Slu03_15500 [Sediminihabitans luteus]